MLRFLRPMAFLRRKAVYAGLLGGNRKWLIWGGLAWVLHWTGRLFGFNDPVPRYTEEVGAGERVIVVHEPVGAITAKKQAAKATKAERKAARRADKAARKAS